MSATSVTKAHYHGSVQLRPPAQINVSTAVAGLKYLTTRTPYKVHILHPSYPAHENVLMTLNALDNASGGIHHGLALDICAILADNLCGFLSTTAHGRAIDAGRHDVLKAGSYFYIVPHPEDCADTSSSYKWPVVTSFHDWTFPQHLPASWQLPSDCPPPQDPMVGSGSQSNYSQAVRFRDQFCRVSGYYSALEAAHLCPESESKWFSDNSMAQYKQNLNADPAYMLKDPANMLLLRKDIHHSFDKQKFVLFPKADDNSLVLHMLASDIDLVQTYHNVQIHAIDSCAREFVYARFAWAMFSLLGPFFQGKTPRYIVTIEDNKRIYKVESDLRLLAKKATDIRSSTSKKRSRPAREDPTVDNDESPAHSNAPSNDDSGRSKRRRKKNQSHTRASQAVDATSSSSIDMTSEDRPKTPPPPQPTYKPADEGESLRKHGLEHQRNVNRNIISSQSHGMKEWDALRFPDPELAWILWEHGIDILDERDDADV